MDINVQMALHEESKKLHDKKIELRDKRNALIEAGKSEEALLVQKELCKITDELSVLSEKMLEDSKE